MGIGISTVELQMTFLIISGFTVGTCQMVFSDSRGAQNDIELITEHVQTISQSMSVDQLPKKIILESSTFSPRDNLVLSLNRDTELPFYSIDNTDKYLCIEYSRYFREEGVTMSEVFDNCEADASVNIILKDPGEEK